MNLFTVHCYREPTEQNHDGWLLVLSETPEQALDLARISGWAATYQHFAIGEQCPISSEIETPCVIGLVHQFEPEPLTS